MENGPFIDDFPINTTICRGFSMAMLNNQMVHEHGFHFQFFHGSGGVFFSPYLFGVSLEDSQGCEAVPTSAGQVANGKLEKDQKHMGSMMEQRLRLDLATILIVRTLESERKPFKCG